MVLSRYFSGASLRSTPQIVQIRLHKHLLHHINKLPSKHVFTKHTLHNRENALNDPPKTKTMHPAPSPSPGALLPSNTASLLDGHPILLATELTLTLITAFIPLWDN